VVDSNYMARTNLTTGELRTIKNRLIEWAKAQIKPSFLNPWKTVSQDKNFANFGKLARAARDASTIFRAGI